MGKLLEQVHAETRRQLKSYVEESVGSKKSRGPLLKADAQRAVETVCTLTEPQDPDLTASGNDVKVLLVDNDSAVVKADEDAVSIDTLASRICTEIGPCLIKANVEDTSKLQPVTSLGTSSVQLLIPDDEASTVVSSTSTKRKRLLGTYSGQVSRLKMNWIKQWKKQWMIVGPEGIAYSKQTTGKDQSTITLDKIQTVIPATQEEVGPKIKLKPDSFLIRTRDDRVNIFSAEGGSLTATKWCKAVVSHALLHAVQHNLGQDRVQHFCELGADVNAALPDGRQYPPLGLALANKAVEVAKYLLRRGADPSCLLRWSFLMVDKVATPAQVLQLLIDTKKDLNVCSDDVHGWTLLHYLAYEGDLESVRRLIARVDVPTIRAVNTLGDCSLMLALKKHPPNPPESVEKMCLALAKNCDVERRDKMNDTVLHLAIRRCQLQLAKRLIELGAKVDERDSGGDTALHSAVKMKLFGLAQWMVDRLGESERANVLNMQDEKRGDTVFALALKLGQEDLALYFLRKGADCSVASRQWDLSPQCEMDSPLQIAIKMKMKTLAEAIVSDFCTSAELAKRDTQGVPALILALERDLLRLSLVIIKSSRRFKHEQREGDSPTTTTSSSSSSDQRPSFFLDVATVKEGDTALLVAVRRGLLMLASTMVDSGADAGCQNVKGQSVLHACVELLTPSGCSTYFAKVVLTFMEGILKLPANISASLRWGEMGYTPLHVAVLRQKIDAASLLLSQRKGLANECDRKGNSSLSLAVQQRHVEMVQLLIDHGVDVNVVNSDSLCPLHLAIQVDSCDIAVILLKQNIYPGVFDLKGWCPVHRASAVDNASMIDVLAKYCSQPGHLDLRTEDGQTSLMLAVKHGCLQVCKSLLRHRVDIRVKMPGSRQTVFHLGADLCQTKKRPFWTSGVPQLLTEIEYTSGQWDLDKKGVTGRDAVEYIKTRLASGEESPRIASSKTVLQTARDASGEVHHELNHPIPVAMPVPATTDDDLRAPRMSATPPLPPLFPTVSSNSSSHEINQSESLPSPPQLSNHSVDAQEPSAADKDIEPKSSKPEQEGQEGQEQGDDGQEYDEEKGSPGPTRDRIEETMDRGSTSKHLESKKLKHSEMKEALDSIPASNKTKILDWVYAEGKRTAEEWLATKNGEQMLLQQAAEIQQAFPEISMTQAKTQAREKFMQNHLQDWMTRFS